MGVDPVTAAIGLGAASTIMGMDSSNKAQKAQKDQFNYVKQIFATLSPETRALYGQAMGAINTGFDSAQKQLMTAGKTAKSNVAIGAAQAGGDLTESSIGRGLFGTSYLDAGRRGIAADVSRQNTAIDEGQAAQIANLLQQKGSAQAALFTGQAAALNNLGTQNASAVSQFQFQPTQTDLLPWAKFLFPQGSGSGGGGQQPYNGQYGSQSDWGG